MGCVFLDRAKPSALFDSHIEFIHIERRGDTAPEMTWKVNKNIWISAPMPFVALNLISNIIASKMKLTWARESSQIVWNPWQQSARIFRLPYIDSAVDFYLIIDWLPSLDECYRFYLMLLVSVSRKLSPACIIFVLILISFAFLTTWKRFKNCQV